MHASETVDALGKEAREGWLADGRGGGARTPDPLIKSQLLFQLSYTSTGSAKNGASEGIRTLDNHLGKVELYQLSYARSFRSELVRLPATKRLSGKLST